MNKTTEFEYQQQIKDLQDLNRKLRFRNAILENKLDAYKTKTAVFVKNTLDLLLGIGMNFKDIQVYYEQVSRNKNTN
ncbi:MAG: hypothetical protein KBT03_04090 [Bacteroidales bacterium]|nr:hypothetical protein [Candidatus Scybalousia scybalohippi]